MWFYIDFQCIDHGADDAGYKMPIETTMINAETEEDALAEFVVGMSGESYMVMGIRHG